MGNTGGQLVAVGADELVDDASSASAKLALFRSRFRGRDDVYALRWENERTGRSGYAPAVAGGWGTAKRTGHREHLPLTDDVLTEHLRGAQTVGLFPLLDGDVCWLLACDFDGDAWQLDALAFHATCVEHGVPAACRSPRGWDHAVATC